jgi:hypothetical protein
MRPYFLEEGGNSGLSFGKKKLKRRKQKIEIDENVSLYSIKLIVFSEKDGRPARGQWPTRKDTELEVEGSFLTIRPVICHVAL